MMEWMRKVKNWYNTNDIFVWLTCLVLSSVFFGSVVGYRYAKVTIEPQIVQIPVEKIVTLTKEVPVECELEHVQPELEDEQDTIDISKFNEEDYYNVGISREAVELIALVTMAEAEAEPEDGKRLVIDTILNRVDSPYFPDTVHDVIYQPSQFTSMWNGRVDRCEVREDYCQLVVEEVASRMNTECVFFRMGHYSKYGVPMFQVGNHYFSKYE